MQLKAPSNPDGLIILVADDHAMILEMIKIYLEQVPDISARIATSLDGALKCIAAEGPFDLVLLDLDMPGMAEEGVARARAANGANPVAILTGHPTPRMVEDLLAAGAIGVVPKTTSLRSLTNAIRFMAAGERYVPMELFRTQDTLRAAMPDPLSKRELMVLEHLSEGQSNRDIGAALGLGEPTVKMHVKSICRKLGAANRTQAVIESRKRRLI